MLEAHFQVFLYFTLLSVFTFGISVAVFKPAEICRYSMIITLFLVIFCIFFVGYRDWRVEEVFVDSIRYGGYYLSFAHKDSGDAKDLGFYVLQKICTGFGVSVELFFVICSALYIIPQAIVSRKISRKFSFLIMLMMITSLSFYDYGVNIIRNGIACSLLLLAFVNYKKTVHFIILCALAVSFHKSTLLPILAFVFVKSVKLDMKWYILIWLGSIPLSFIVKEVASDFILAIDIISDRADKYLTHEADLRKFSKVGFRYDFVLYSAIPIVIGWYFIVKKGFKDRFYTILYSTYLLANAGWVIINEVPSSNRFAYLSWFMMPVLIIYPFLFYDRIKYRYPKISLILVAHLCFTLIFK